MNRSLRPANALRGYQRKAIVHTLDHKLVMLWLDCGLGKTVVSLTTILHLTNTFDVWGVLIVGPMRVVQTVWMQEAAEWAHTQGLTFSLIHGKRETRVRALRRKVDIYLVNYENLKWLTDELQSVYLSAGRPLPFNMLILDEITRVKKTRTKQGSKRAGYLLKVVRPHMQRVVGLTGTPAPNGYKDLFGQYLMLDQGARLGTSYESYLGRFFRQVGRGGYRYELMPGCKEIIHGLIQDITLEMSKEDYLDLPPVHINEVKVILPSKVRAQYEELERKMFVELEEGCVEAVNKASLLNKCHQMACGSVYTQPDAYEVLHHEKLDALEEIVEEAGGPVLVAYPFRHGLDMIKARFKDLAVHLHGGMNAKQADEVVHRWNAGEIRILVGQPASIGHGLNLQYGSHTVAWFGLTWDLELYSQLNQRIDRQGQTLPVTIHHILAEKTVDYAIRAALELKADNESNLRQAIKAYRASL